MRGVPSNEWLFSWPRSNLAYTLGKVPAASRSMIGVEGLCFFMVGYVRVRKALVMARRQTG